MNIDQVLKEIYAGQTVTMEFPSDTSREKFRQRLYKEKQIQDKILNDVLDEERQKLRFQFIDSFIEDDVVAECCRAKMWLTEKVQPDYKVISIEETTDESTSTISGSVGTASQESEETSKSSGSS